MTEQVLEAVPAWGQALLDRVASLDGYIKSDKLTVQHLAERVASLERRVDLLWAEDTEILMEVIPRGPHD